MGAASRLAREEKIAAGTTKLALRQAMSSVLPPAAAERAKLGFPVPIGFWLKGEMYGYAERLLREARTDQWIDRQAALGLLEQFRAGDPEVSWRHIWVLPVFRPGTRSTSSGCTTRPRWARSVTQPRARPGQTSWAQRVGLAGCAQQAGPGLGCGVPSGRRAEPAGRTGAPARSVGQKLVPQPPAATVQPGHHGADRRAHDLGDLFVRDPSMSARYTATRNSSAGRGAPAGSQVSQPVERVGPADRAWAASGSAGSRHSWKSPLDACRGSRRRLR